MKSGHTFGFSGEWTGADIHSSGRHTCRKFLREKRSRLTPPSPPSALPAPAPSPRHRHSIPFLPGVHRAWSLPSGSVPGAPVWDSPPSSHPDTGLSTPKPSTCKEGHEQGYPAQDVGPGKAPIPEAATEEADGDSSVNGQGQQDEKCWRERSGVGVGEWGWGRVWRWGWE